MGWVDDNIIEPIGDYIIDPITGEDKREAAQKSTEAGRVAAAQARDIAVEYNQKALDAQLAALEDRERQAKETYGSQLGFLGSGYDDASAAMAQTYGRLDPAISAGGGALAQLAGLYGIGSPEQQEAALAAFQTSPGYEFRKAEGEKALRRMASATGKLGSGSMYKDLMRYGQGLASDEYGNYVGQLQSLASQFPTETLSRLGLTEAEVARQYGVQRADVASQLGGALDLFGGLRGDARSTAYLSEGAAKAGYETTAGNLLSQLALVPGGNIMSTVTNMGQLSDSMTSSLSNVADIMKLG